MGGRPLADPFSSLSRSSYPKRKATHSVPADGTAAFIDCCCGLPAADVKFLSSVHRAPKMLAGTSSRVIRGSTYEL